MASAGEQHRTRGRPRSPEAERPTATVQALDRGLTVLALLSRTDAATLTEISLQVEMPASTVHRILATLERHGMVAFEEASQTWRIGVETFRIGSAFIRRAKYIEAGREVMRHLRDESGETANMAIAEQGDVVFVSQVECHEPIRAFFRPGTRGHMHASGIGKALLAELPRREVEAIVERKGLPSFTGNTITAPDALFAELERIRARGWSVDDEERTMGMRCLAAPIFNEYHEAIAGISVSGPAVRLPDDRLAELGPIVRRAANQVTAMIGGQEA